MAGQNVGKRNRNSTWFLHLVHFQAPRSETTHCPCADLLAKLQKPWENRQKRWGPIAIGLPQAQCQYIPATESDDWSHHTSPVYVGLCF